MIAFDTLTSSQFDSLTSAQFAPMPSVYVPPIVMDLITSQLYQPAMQAVQIIEYTLAELEASPSC